MPFKQYAFLGILIDFAASGIRKCTQIQRRVNRLHTSMTTDTSSRPNLDR